MTEAQAVEAIAEAWQDGWELLHPDDPADPDYVPYVYDNEELTAPALWARVTIAHSVAVVGTMGPAGARRFDRRGNIAVQLFGDVNVGRLQLSCLADDVRSVLEAKPILSGSDVLVTFAGTTREGKTDGRWNQSMIVIPFRYYEQR